MNIAFLFNHRSQRVTVLRQCRDVLAYEGWEEDNDTDIWNILLWNAIVIINIDIEIITMIMFPLFTEWTLASKSTNERRNILKTELIFKSQSLWAWEEMVTPDA